MSIDWEATFDTWSRPSSETEDTKSNNAEKMVRDAVSENTILKQKNISIIPQGSYHNNTNVKQDSDVDICVCCNETIYQDFSLIPLSNVLLKKLPPAIYQYDQFKNDLGNALTIKFGILNVIRGDKAYEIHANTYRINADVVPAFEYHLYLPNHSFLTGVFLVSDSGQIIINWPKQHYDNGVNKNLATSYKFKYITRIVKRLRNKMFEEKIIETNSIASYLIECLIYNVPDYFFDEKSYLTIVKNAISYLWHEINNDRCNDWREVNNIKNLFDIYQKWNKQQVLNFLLKAWHYIAN